MTGRWRCRWLGWHPQPFDVLGFDGLSVRARCQRCGYIGLVDSTGGLF